MEAITAERLIAIAPHIQYLNKSLPCLDRDIDNLRHQVECQRSYCGLPWWRRIFRRPPEITAWPEYVVLAQRIRELVAAYGQLPADQNFVGHASFTRKSPPTYAEVEEHAGRLLNQAFRGLFYDKNSLRLAVFQEGLTFRIHFRANVDWDASAAGEPLERAVDLRVSAIPVQINPVRLYAPYIEAPPNTK